MVFIFMQVYLSIFKFKDSHRRSYEAVSSYAEKKNWGADKARNDNRDQFREFDNVTKKRSMTSYSARTIVSLNVECWLESVPHVSPALALLQAVSLLFRSASIWLMYLNGCRCV